jgi:hypothetical protein
LGEFKLQMHHFEQLAWLHEKGYISNPIGKAKSVGLSEEGLRKAKELFERHLTQ